MNRREIIVSIVTFLITAALAVFVNYAPDLAMELRDKHSKVTAPAPTGQ